MWKKLTRITLILVLALMTGNSYAQEAWSLEKCIQYAQQNSLAVRQAQNTVRNAELTTQQNRLSRLPSFNATVSGGYQFGRTIDPVTNDFNNEQIGFNSYSINGGITLFGGNRINNSIKQSRIEQEAAKLDASATSNNIALDVAAAYLNILLSEEELENARRRLEQSTRQLEQTDKLIAAGSLPRNDRLDFVSQVALDEQNIIETENLVAINYLNLKQLLELDPNQDIRIERPEILIPADADPNQFTLNGLFSNAMRTLPEMRASELRIESASLDIDLAKAALLPSLNFGASMSSNFSTLARAIDGFETVRQSQTVFINNDPVNFEVEVTQPASFSQKSFWDQFTENFGQSLGLSLNVPIYNNHRNKINMERARLGVISAELNNRQMRQQLKSDIQRAIADARAAKLSLEASRKSLEAAEAAFENAEKRFDLGAINSLEYLTARNNLDQARTNLTRARYQYLFNLKNVEFYQGKPLRLQ